jgi:peptidoglycan hydrolase CwlO-like protein
VYAGSTEPPSCKEKNMNMNMHIIYVLSALAAFCVGLSSDIAFAQQPPAPTVQSTAEDANRIIGALQTQRNNALDQAVSAQAATAKVQTDLAAAKKEIEDLKAKIPVAPIAPVDPAK